MNGKALLIVDVQKDFLPDGALGVPNGDEVIPVVNRLQKQQEKQKEFDLIVASKDWHPRDHGSFAVNHGLPVGAMIDLDGLQQVLWPVHCVQDTPGAEFVDDLDVKGIDKVFYKGTDKNIDSYSTFFDNGRRQATGLGDYLKARGVTDLVVVGLATDYCVKFSVLDALDLGFRVEVVREGCRGIDLHPGDCERAFEEMRDSGAEIV